MNENTMKAVSELYNLRRELTTLEDFYDAESNLDKKNLIRENVKMISYIMAVLSICDENPALARSSTEFIELVNEDFKAMISTLSQEK